MGLGSSHRPVFFGFRDITTPPPELPAGEGDVPDDFTSNTTYTAPSGATLAMVMAVGGGGGGGGVTSGSSANRCAPGGECGAFVIKIGIPIEEIDGQDVVIGAGGDGNSGAAGDDGADTTVPLSTDTDIVAAGGSGAAAKSGVSPSGISYADNGSTNADILIPNHVVMGTVTAGLLGTQEGRGGHGGGTPWGQDGGGGYANSGDSAGGAASDGIGAGGGGAMHTSSGNALSGGAGGNGRVTIWAG